MPCFLILFALEHKAVIGKGFPSLWNGIYGELLDSPAHQPALQKKAFGQLHWTAQEQPRWPGFSSAIEGIFNSLIGTD